MSPNRREFLRAALAAVVAPVVPVPVSAGRMPVKDAPAIAGAMGYTVAVETVPAGGGFATASTLRFGNNVIRFNWSGTLCTIDVCPGPGWQTVAVSPWYDAGPTGDAE